MLPFWLTLSTKVTIAQGPIKLWEFIHPTYYLGLSAALVALLTLMLGRRNYSRYKPITHPLFVALITAMYMQLPSLALFQYPFSDHSHHAMPIYWILRNHDICWPKHLGHPETVSPQLAIAALMMVTSESSAFTLHRMSLLILPTLMIIYMYLLSRSIGLTRTYSAVTAVLALALTYQLYYFLRQTYTMPIYVLTAYLIVRSIEDRRYLVPLIVLIPAFISMDPAFVLVTILALAVYPIVQALRTILLKLRGVARNIRIKNISLIVMISILLFGSYMLWIFNRYPYQPRDLYHIAQHAWDTAMRALHEPSTLTPKQQYYWGKPTALAYNQYYSVLYDIKALTRVSSIVFGALASLLILVSRKIRDKIQVVKFLLIFSYFIVTTITIITKSYGATFAPWTALACSIAVDLLRKPLYKEISAGEYLKYLICTLAVIVVISNSHYLLVPGERLSLQDIKLSFWLSKHLPSGHEVPILVPLTVTGGVFTDLTYIITNTTIYTYGSIPWKGSISVVINCLKANNVILPQTVISIVWERTVLINKLQSIIETFVLELSNTHNLIYMSGVSNSEYSFWVKT